jgi:hypothetical protein
MDRVSAAVFMRVQRDVTTGTSIALRPTPQTAKWESTMKFKFGMQQALTSSAVFVLVLIALVSVDDRVRERFNEVMSNGQTVGSWGDRASYVGDALFTAAKHQSIENAPLVVFATAGAILFLFMVRT